jgi:hypothetical protein
MSWTKDVQAPYGTGTCRVCGRKFTLTKWGRVRRHGNKITDLAHPKWNQHCGGSGRPPQEAVPE